MRVALILNNRVYNVFESSFLPPNHSSPNGTEFIYVDVSGKSIPEGSKYDPVTEEIFPKPSYPKVVEWKGYSPEITWDEENFKWLFNYVPAVKASIDSLLKEIEARDYRALKAIKLDVPLESLYPGEKEWYEGKIEELHKAEVDLAELFGVKET